MAEANVYLEWLQFAKSDLDNAAHLYRTMYPMPREIICYGHVTAQMKKDSPSRMERHISTL